MIPDPTLSLIRAMCFAAAGTAYLLATVFYEAYLFSRRRRWDRLATGVAWVGVVCHTTGIAVRHSMSHQGMVGAPFSSVAESLSFVVWAIVLIHLIVQLRIKLTALGSVILPIAFLTILLASVMPSEGNQLVAMSERRLMIAHVASSLIGFACFVLAFCCAVVYLVEDRLLKKKRVSGLFLRLPPLDLMDTAAHHLVALGFAMLTVGLVTGVAWAQRAWPSFWHLDAKVWATALTWAIYAVYLTTGNLLGWRGKKTNYILVAGFLAVLVTILSPTGLHRFS